MSLNKNEKDDLLKVLKKNISIKLDELEEYKKKYKKSQEYLEKCNELAEEYYDLMGEFYKVYQDYERVWGVQPMDERYIRKQGLYKRLFKTKDILFNQLYYGIHKDDEIKENPENIICMEYILIPTGNIEVYHDSEYAIYKEKLLQRKENWFKNKEEKNATK